jgi:signal transduction histidine kinase
MIAAVAAVASDLRPTRASHLVVPTVALAYAVAVVLAVPEDGVVTTYRAASPAAAVLDLGAGLGLVLAGLAVMRARPGSIVGPLAAGAGVTWFGLDWEGWEGGPDAVRALGMAVAPFTFALLAHLVIASAGPVRGRRRAAVAALYAVAAVAGLVGVLVHDPFFDVGCARWCGPNPFAVLADPGLASALETAARVWTVAAGAALAAFCTTCLVRARPPARRLLRAVQLPGVLVGIAWAAAAAVLLVGPPDGPDVAVHRGAFMGCAAAAVALATGLGVDLREAHRRRAVVAGLAAGPAPGALREILAAAVGDPQLEIAYRLRAATRYVDAEGRPVDTARAAPGRAATPIVRDGRELAVILHDGAGPGAAELEREIGPAARLAIENECLGAEVRAQMRDLRASRERIVEAGDAERRRLERDLHDGAQQRLLALTYDLRVASAAAGPALAPLLDRAGAEAQRALEELRDLAHGIYPVVLAEAGLAAALATLADTAPIAVELDDVVAERLAPAVETAAYLTVAEVVAAAADDEATVARVSVRRAASDLAVRVEHDGAGAARRRLAVADRLGTLGARLESGPGHVRAVIPCA